jgi:hypothetical protein
LAILLCAIVAAFWMPGCAHPAFFSPSHPYDFNDYLKDREKWATDSIPRLEERYYQSIDSIRPREEERRLIRERIVFALMDLIDMYQYKFNSELYGRSVARNSVGEIMAAGLGTAAAVTTPLRASQLLTALSTGTTGSLTIMNKNFVRDNTLDLIIDRLESIRKGVRARIILQLDSSTEKYPLGQAVLDVQEYARGGTIFAAIRALGQDNAKAAHEADSVLVKNQ